MPSFVTGRPKTKHGWWHESGDNYLDLLRYREKFYMKSGDNKCSVIVGFTPYHSMVAEVLLDDIDGEVYCLFSKRWPVSNRLYNKLNPLNGRGAGFVVGFLFLMRLIKKYKKKGVAIDVYIPHPGHVYTNYLFFNRGFNNLILYEDGLLNYVDSYSRNSFINWPKRFFAYIFGAPYRDYYGHVTGCDDGIYSAAYLSRPECAVRKKSLGVISSIKSKFMVGGLVENSILFLDQDTRGYISEVDREALIFSMFESFSASGFNYYYKPHHDFSSVVKSKMCALSPELNALPAELIIEKLKPAIVVSFFSSALMSIKKISPEALCISLCAGSISFSVDGEKKSLKEIFVNFGVSEL